MNGLARRVERLEGSTYVQQGPSMPLLVFEPSGRPWSVTHSRTRFTREADESESEFKKRIRQAVSPDIWENDFFWIHIAPWRAN